MTPRPRGSELEPWPGGMTGYTAQQGDEKTAGEEHLWDERLERTEPERRTGSEAE